MVYLLSKSFDVVLLSHLIKFAWGDDTFGDFYPKERALRLNYSCCVYKGKSELDL